MANPKAGANPAATPADELRAHKRLLRDLQRHLGDVARCPLCVAPADALEGRHAAEWTKLKARIAELARDPVAEKEPN
jgi:hypothetical protein